MAPQLTATKGRPARSLSPWMARAIISLPTPDSPSISIGMLDCAPRRPRRSTLAMAGEAAMRSAKVSAPPTFLLRRFTSSVSALTLSRFWIETLRRSGLDRLDHEIVGPGAHRLDDGFDRALRGLDDDRQVAADRLHAVEEFEPGHVRHVEVEDDQFDGAAGLAFQHFQRLQAAIDRHRVAAEAANHFLENSTLSRIVFDNENADSHAPVNFFFICFFRRTRRPGPRIRAGSESPLPGG